MVTHIVASLRGRRGQLAMSLVAIMLATAFLTAAGLHTRTMRAELAAITTGRLPDVVVAARSAFDPNRTDTMPAAYSDADIARVSQIPGVAEVMAQRAVEGADVTSSVNGSALTGLNPATVTGWVDFPMSTGQPALRLVEGHTPGPGQVVLDRVTLEHSGHHLGDRITVAFPAGGTAVAEDLELVGVAEWSAGTDASQWIFMNETQLDEIAGDQARCRLWVHLAAGQDADGVARDIAAALPDSDVLTAEQAAELAQGANSILFIVGSLLIGFAVIALLVAASLIVNTFSVLVMQRARELALLRALGASPGQLRVMVLGEAAATGLVGSLAGTGLGWAAAVGIATVTAPSAPTPGPSLTMFALVVAAGLLVAVVAALLPARRACRIAPVTAMRGETRQVPAAAPSSSASLGCRRVPARLALLNLRRTPGRVVATAGTLTVCLGLVSLLAVVGSSAKASIGVLMPEAMTASLLVLSPAPLGSEMIDTVRAHPQVTSVHAFEAAGASVDGQQSAVTALAPEDIGSAIRQTITEGRAPDSAYELLISSTIRDQRHLQVGQEVPGVVAGTEVTWRIVGVFDYPPNISMGDFMTHPSTLRAAGLPPAIQTLAVHCAPGSDIAAVKAELWPELHRMPGVKLLDVAEFNAHAGVQIDSILRLLNGLVAITALIAALGIMNTIGLAITERTREIGLLRAVGMTRGQVRTMVACEAVLLSLLGGLSGITGGTVLGALVHYTNRDSLVALGIPWSQLGIMLGTSICIGLLAALVPAWRAAGTPVLDVLAGPGGR